MSISPARSSAFDILVRIESERAFSSVLLPLYEERLSPADRSLCHELVLGTLRHQIKLDRITELLSKGRKLDAAVRVALRLGLFQILHLDRVPARAAINESVELVRRARKTSATGLVNALLRRGTREDLELCFDNDVERISVETSHPEWLVRRWSEQLGAASAESLAKSNNLPPQIAFRVLAKGDPEVRELIKGTARSENAGGCYLVDRSTTLLRRLAAESKIYLQDEASQMVAHAVKVSPKGSFLDVCAAPGGKTALVTHLADARLSVAGDLHQQRVEFLRQNCERQRASVSVLRYNADGGLPFGEAAFDAVLVDAPCSGTGTIRHNPEIRYLLAEGDLTELSSKQRRILAEASKTVRKGGQLVYSTCSLEEEEGEEVAGWFLASDRGFIAEEPNVPGRFLTVQGFARTWPHKDDLDGFFIAAFRRV